MQMRFPLAMRVDVTVPGMGDALMASDGEHIWTQDPESDSYQIDEPDAAPFSIVLSPYTRFGVTMLHYTDDLEYDELVEFGDAKCHRVEVDGKHGAKVEALYFDAKSGKPAGLSIEGPDGEEAQVVFGKWEEVDGVNMVTSASIALMGMPVELTFSDFAWNKVDDEALKMPEAVKKTLDERKAKETADDADKGDGGDDHDK